MTREEIQSEALKALEDNNYFGTIVLSVGTGKSKVAIDAIENSKLNKILITSPRTNLKNNWKNELKKWGFINDNISYFSTDKRELTIIIENIHITYKYNEETIKSFDLIIIDEVHALSEKYFKLIEIAKKFNIPIIGLTGTPNKKNEFKEDILYKELPIIYEYLDSEKDGIVNKINYYLYQYELTDNYKIQAGNKSKNWLIGEKTQYKYIEDTFNQSKTLISQYYFNEIKQRVDILNKSNIRDSYKRFYNKIISKDLDYFRKIYWQSMKAKRMPYNLYQNLRYLSKNDYAKFGLKAELYASIAPEPVKQYFYKYIWARNARKDFLLNLNSSSEIAVKIKNKLLENNNNKILLFSELTNQSEKLSKYNIHSKTGATPKKTLEQNALILEKFNKGEIRELSSCLSLTLGLNLDKTNWAIFESFSGSDTNSKQKSGRLNRLKVDEIANVLIILPINTQSEQWYLNAFSDIENIAIIKDLELFIENLI